MTNPLYSGANWHSAEWYTGTTNPNSLLGLDGDFFLNTVSENIFIKTQGNWQSFSNIKGLPGNIGQGLASGGADQLLISKLSSANYDTAWRPLDGLDISTALGYSPLISETDTLASVTARGNTTSNSIQITNTTDSSSTNSGALVVQGGLSVAGTLNATSFVGPLTGTVTGTLTGNMTGNVTGTVSGVVVGTVTGTASGYAGTVSNGVYTYNTYTDPTWLTLTQSKVGLATVASTNNYNDLVNKPTPYSLPIASTSTRGGIRPDGTSLKVTHVPSTIGYWLGGSFLGTGKIYFSQPTFTATTLININNTTALGQDLAATLTNITSGKKLVIFLGRIGSIDNYVVYNVNTRTVLGIANMLYGVSYVSRVGLVDNVHVFDQPYSVTSFEVGQTVSFPSTGSVLVGYAGYTLPRATTTVKGGVLVDGTTIVSNNGTISATTAYTLPIATTSVRGGVRVDGNTLGYAVDGTISALNVPLVTAGNSLIAVKVDGTTITANAATGALSHTSEPTDILTKYSLHTTRNNATLKPPNSLGTFSLKHVYSTTSTNNGHNKMEIRPDGRFIYTVGNSFNIVWTAINLETGTLGGFSFISGGVQIDQLVISSNSAYLYLTSSNDNSIKVYSLAASSGTPTLVQTVSSQPNQFGEIFTDPFDRFIYVLNPVGSIQVALINSSNGQLSAFSTAYTWIHGTVGNVSLAFHPDGRTVFIQESSSASLRSFAINQTTGVFTLNNSVTSASNYWYCVVDPQGKYVAQIGFQNSPYWKAYGIDRLTGFIDSTAESPNVALDQQPGRNVRFDQTGNFVIIDSFGTNTILHLYSIKSYAPQSKESTAFLTARLISGGSSGKNLRLHPNQRWLYAFIDNTIFEQFAVSSGNFGDYRVTNFYKNYYLTEANRFNTSLLYSRSPLYAPSYKNYTADQLIMRTGTQPITVSFEYLIVGGGGGGGRDIGGGGGGGGVLYGTGTLIAGTTYSVTVGQGGIGASFTGTKGNDGGNSSIIGGALNLVALGGGGGASRSSSPGGTGGSGGGGALTVGPGSGTPGQGFAGASGTGTGGSGSTGGGGGGAGTSASGVNGGAGALYTDWATATSSGSSNRYAGGGGGGALTTTGGTPGSGGLGGGATALSDNNSGANGAPNTGGGGAGQSSAGAGNGGTGGSGIVLIRYLISANSGHTASSGTVYTNVGGFVYHKFISGGTFTINGALGRSEELFIDSDGQSLYRLDNSTGYIKTHAISRVMGLINETANLYTGQYVGNSLKFPLVQVGNYVYYLDSSQYIQRRDIPSLGTLGTQTTTYANVINSPSTALMASDPRGRYFIVYEPSSLRIKIFSVDSTGAYTSTYDQVVIGNLTAMAVDPTGRFLALVSSAGLYIGEIMDGFVLDVAATATVVSNSPASIHWDPTGRFIVLGNYTYTVSPSTNFSGTVQVVKFDRANYKPGTLGTLTVDTYSIPNAENIKTVMWDTTGTKFFVYYTEEISATVTHPYEAVWTTPGSYTWVCPAGVTSVSVVCVGGGGSGVSANVANGGRGGGGGGGLVYGVRTVTPGSTYTVVVGAGGSTEGASGGSSYFISSLNMIALGGGPGLRVFGDAVNSTGGSGGSYSYSVSGTNGNNGGAGGNGNGVASGGGGGGAAGYLGDGGAGSAGLQNQFVASGSNGLGGGGGGGAGGGGPAGTAYGPGGRGGSVGLGGQGLNGTGGLAELSGASQKQGGGGVAGSLRMTTRPRIGGGGGGNANSYDSGESGVGSDGAVRIIWGGDRRFPNYNTQRSALAQFNVNLITGFATYVGKVDLTGHTDAHDNTPLGTLCVANPKGGTFYVKEGGNLSYFSSHNFEQSSATFVRVHANTLINNCQTPTVTTTEIQCNVQLSNIFIINTNPTLTWRFNFANVPINSTTAYIKIVVFVFGTNNSQINYNQATVNGSPITIRNVNNSLPTNTANFNKWIKYELYIDRNNSKILMRLIDV